MSTPRSIEFKKNIIIGVSNNLIEIFTYDYLYWSVIWEGDFLRFKEFGKFLLFPVIDESCDFWSCEWFGVSWEHVFVDSLGSKLNNNYSWNIFFCDSNEFGKSLLNSLCYSGGWEKDFTFIFLSSFSEGFIKRLAFSAFFVSEQKYGWSLFLENWFNVLISEFNNSRDRARLNPFCNSFLIPCSTINKFRLIKLSE